MTLLLALTLLAPQGDLKFIPEGMTKKTGGYSPIRAEMTANASAIKKAPGGLMAPMYGTMKFGDKSFAFISDEPAQGDWKLYVDTNADGDLTNDPATDWKAQKSGAKYMGWAKVTVNGQQASVGLYRFDPADPQRAALKSVLLYYSDFGYEGRMAFGDHTYPVQFSGALSPISRIWVDRNANGKSDGRSENISAGKPFNFDGTTYELKFDGGKMNVVKSAQTVAEYKLPPNLAVGQPVPSFVATAMDGTAIQFPKSYEGKIVMLDFWATWCGPCIAELPNVIKAYEKYHDKGFEILGVSFDQKDQGEKVSSFAKEHNMPWRQIYEGKYWDTDLGLQFGVEGIPFSLIVDGTTGRILAYSPRGEALDKALEAAFAARKSGGGN